MKLDFNRMAKLAGITTAGPSRRLSESKNPLAMARAAKSEDVAADMLDEMYEEDEEGQSEMDHSMEEMIEVDEVMLVQELRRAKKHLNESKKRARAKNNQEAKLKQIIEREVKDIFGTDSDEDLNLSAGWMYGRKKPTASRKGHVHQGMFLKGIGFQ
jgi:predicted transcriptional regulator